MSHFDASYFFFECFFLIDSWLCDKLTPKGMFQESKLSWLQVFRCFFPCFSFLWLVWINLFLREDGWANLKVLSSVWKFAMTAKLPHRWIFRVFLKLDEAMLETILQWFLYSTFHLFYKSWENCSTFCIDFGQYAYF